MVKSNEKGIPHINQTKLSYDTATKEVESNDLKYKKSGDKMGRLYKINPTCPHCGEEHECWTIRLKDE